MGLFENKVVVITGAASGIGLAAAKAFAEEGAKLALVDIQGKELEKVAAELGDDVLALTADVSKEADVEKYVKDTVDRFGRIDVFINNAGINGPYEPMEEMTADNWVSILGVNVFGVLYGLKHVLRVMEKQGSGAVVNTSSLGGWSGSPGASAYVASKHAVLGITKSVALEVAASGIRVNAVAPTYVATNMASSLPSDSGIPEIDGVERKLKSKVPMNRPAKPSEIADLMVYLASDKASFITGTYIRIDGGNAATSA